MRRGCDHTEKCLKALRLCHSRLLGLQREWTGRRDKNWTESAKREREKEADAKGRLLVRLYQKMFISET